MPMLIMTRLLAGAAVVVFVLTAGLQAGVHHSIASFESEGKRIAIESYCADHPSDAPAVVVLHGSGGVQASREAHWDQWRTLIGQGYCIWLPHYLDSTGGSAQDPNLHYSIWVRTVADAAHFIGIGRQRGMALIGYSLGASVALSVASQGIPLKALVAWGGSLPDQYFQSFQNIPPALILHGERDSIVPVWNAKQLERLCKMRSLDCAVRIYPGEKHNFGPSADADATPGLRLSCGRLCRPTTRHPCLRARPR